LKKTLDKTKDPAKKRKLRYLLHRMKEQKRAKEHRHIMKQVEEEHRKSELEKVSYCCTSSCFIVLVRSYFL